MSLLEVNNLGITFGGLHAVEDVALNIEPGEIVGLIGPNGAGKTTVFNLLTKVYTPTAGEISLDGKSILKLSTHHITQSGIMRTFQNIRLFKKLAVIDNVKIAFHHQMNYTPLEGILRLPRYWREERLADKKAREFLAVFDLERFAGAPASRLSYGQQRKLEICRALASNPKVILLDEPAAGMNPSETQELMQTIREIRERFSVSILLIEHDMKLVMGICERIYVLNYGRVIAQGTPEEIKHNPQVVAAYLGGHVKEKAAAEEAGAC